MNDSDKNKNPRLTGNFIGIRRDVDGGMIYSSGFNTCCQPSDWDLTTGIININSTVSRQSVSFSMLKSVQDTWCLLVCSIKSKIFYSRDRHDITVIIWKMHFDSHRKSTFHALRWRNSV